MLSQFVFILKIRITQAFPLLVTVSRHDVSVLIEITLGHLLNPFQPKGSIGHAFTVRIHTENQNQASFSPVRRHEVSVLIELTLGHLRYRLTDVPSAQKIFEKKRKTSLSGKLPKKSAKHHGGENCPKTANSGNRIFLDLPRSSSIFLDLPRSSSIFPRFSSIFSSIFLDLPRSSSIFLDLPRSSSISLDLPRSSSIFLDLPRSSSIFLDLPRSSSIIPRSSSVLKSAQQIRYRWLQHPQSAFQHPQSACLVDI